MRREADPAARGREEHIRESRVAGLRFEDEVHVVHESEPRLGGRAFGGRFAGIRILRHLLLEDSLNKIGPIWEATVERGDADAGLASDRVQWCARAAPAEHGSGGAQDRLPVAHGVDAQRC